MSIGNLYLHSGQIIGENRLCLFQRNVSLLRLLSHVAEVMKYSAAMPKLLEKTVPREYVYSVGRLHAELGETLLEIRALFASFLNVYSGLLGQEVISLLGVQLTCFTRARLMLLINQCKWTLDAYLELEVRVTWIKRFTIVREC